MNNRIDLTDIREEAVAEALALGSALDKSCNIDELQRCGRKLLRLIDLRELFEPCIRHRHDADILVDRAERIVCGFCAGICQRIEQRAFADIRQSDHSEFHVI